MRAWRRPAPAARLAADVRCVAWHSNTLEQLRMRISLGAIGLLVLVLSAAVAVAAPVQPPPTIAARSHVLIDFNTGKVLTGQNEHQRAEPASLTKIMTAYTV